MDAKIVKLKLKKKFYVYCVGTLCSLASYTSVAVLQSSINIQDGLGLYSLAIAYSVSVVFGIFVAPSLLRKFGCKPVLIAGEIGYLIYVIGNFYPTKLVLLLAGVIIGMGEACVWLSIPIINSNFGKQHSMIGEKKESVYIQKYIGTFFAISQINTIIGHILSYVILNGGKQIEEITTYSTNHSATQQDNMTMTTITNYNIAIVNEKASVYNFCGRNDCQNPNVTSQNMSQYIPHNKLLLYIFFGVVCVISLTGILLHVLFLENVQVSSSHSRKINKDEAKHSEEKVEFIDKNSKIKGIGAASLIGRTIFNTLTHCVLPAQLLITPLSFYYGLFMAFVFGELPRAFTSCVLGVEQVGICLVGYASVNCAVAYMSGKLAHRIGRNVILCFVFCVDCCNYAFCLLWTPVEGHTWPIYFIFITFGFTDGLLKTSILMIYSEYFPSNYEIAYTAWNIVITLGVALHFGLSTYFCVWQKIYFCLITYTVGILLYGVSETIKYKNSQNGEKNQQ